MQRERHHLLYIRTHMGIGDEHAAGIKGASERAVVVKHKVRVVPLAVELERRPGAAAEDRVIVGVKKSRFALEIGAGSLFEVSADAEAVSLTPRRAEKAMAADMRNRAVGAAPSGGGRDAHEEDVVAGGVGMELSPSGPAGINMEVAAHEECPWRDDGINGAHQYDAEGKSTKYLHEASGTGF